ncbi:extracellular solute-binding protein family 1 [Beutenbergia cavernae DSM 12333]|uniref:Extracellular solute-binding protein family 1 n=1 Tax=Beutenbergia cavernae (strain ATCC BAA-8 / DSM 12333 / CCUG 43141 / JCM 11478 / NBRC 16432 / NCIMB 13614 / HKI 0122) TaxID=471853 RepID=C5C1F6_BEUC1|nr:extracellular solute-binding protein [Beutenbergia cavernae]ACQ81566.1 extracellular solute-binding protein family 1 [Beutenbergia cavernae DSM 12333]
MRTTRRRNAAAVVAAALAITLAACSSDGGSEDETPDESELGQVGAMEDYDVGTTFVATEPVEFGLLYRDHPNYPLQEDWLLLQSLEEDHNVSFDITSAPLAEWDQRKGLLIGAGDAPEIISVTYPGQEVQFVAGGAILPVSDYLQYLPNFTAKVEEWGLEEALDQRRQEDGKFYMLPGLRESDRPMYTYAVRADVWEELGLSLEPASFDEFADQLRTVHEAYPDVWPLSDRWSANGPLEATLNFAAPNFGTSAGWGYGEGVTWDADAEEFVYTGATEEYRALLEYYNGLITDGLMDPESLTQDDDQAIQKFGSGQSMAIAANDQEILRYRDTFTELGTDAETALIRVPAGPAGDNVPAGTRLQSGLMISADAADSDHFLALLQFIDWLYYSDEGLEFAKWGVEGETFTWDGETRVLVDDIDINGLNPGAPTQLNVDYGFHNGVWMLEHGSTDDLDQSMLRPEVIDFVESMSNREELTLPPPWPLNEMEREQVSLLQTALKDHVWQNTAAFILGQRSFDEWDAYVAELEGLNVQQYLDVANTAQERFAESSSE